ncbi:phosphatase PAP2 family protein [Mesorhizobium sp. M0751]|uniref:phosphatase PAP2 family protein n=1 Tax=Mesorhizobium sp. M0751 TaxID=2956992 RepID=UPI0033358AA7
MPIALLEGNRPGQHLIRINDQFPVCFQRVAGAAGKQQNLVHGEGHGTGRLVLAMWLIAPVLVAGGLVLGFGLLAEEVIEVDTSGFDRAVLMAFRNADDPTNPIGPPWLEEMGRRDVTSLGSFAFLVSVTAVGYLVITGKRSYAVLVAAAVAGGEAISTLLKIAFDRPRPDVIHTTRVFTASFPSGHAMLSAVSFLTLGALLATRRTPIPASKRISFRLRCF